MDFCVKKMEHFFLMNKITKVYKFFIFIQINIFYCINMNTCSVNLIGLYHFNLIEIVMVNENHRVILHFVIVYLPSFLLCIISPFFDTPCPVIQAANLSQGVVIEQP